MTISTRTLIAGGATLAVAGGILAAAISGASTWHARRTSEVGLNCYFDCLRRCVESPGVPTTLCGQACERVCSRGPFIDPGRLVATATDPGDPDPSAGEDDALGVAFLKITCTKRGENGQCNQAKCEREKDPDSPTGFEVQSCAKFLVSCEVFGHEADGGRNNATCTRLSA